nr:hypothetical protein [Tanacetum cinerariifolium]
MNPEQHQASSEHTHIYSRISKSACATCVTYDCQGGKWGVVNKLRSCDLFDVVGLQGVGSVSGGKSGSTDSVLTGCEFEGYTSLVPQSYKGLCMLEEVKYVKKKLGVEFISDYDCEIRYHPRKANIVVRALSRKERVKPGRLRAMAMTIQSRVKRMILAAQSEAFKEENNPAKRLHGLDQQIKSKEDGGCTLWTNYGIHCKCLTGSKVKDEHQRPSDSLKNAIGYEYGLSSSDGWTKLIGPELVEETTDKVVLIKEKLKATRDRLKSYASNRIKPLELRIDPVPYNLSLPEELNEVHDTFHVLNLKKCLVDANLHLPLEEIKIEKNPSFC